jgi:iduronate 2-sulfatase
MSFSLGRASLALICFGCLSTLATAEKLNVLMILVDDLKPALGCYGDSAAKTPHLDNLAASGMRFDLAYCNQAVCAPSRFTLMLGAHSTSTGLYGLGSQLRKRLPKAVTLPQHFAQHGGYETHSVGKVYHVGHGNEGDPQSFNMSVFKDKVIEYAIAQPNGLTREEALFTNQALDRIPSLPRGPAYESAPVEDNAYADGRVAAEAVRRLGEMKKPFFMAVGFVRPHLPFCAPQKYWEMHDPEKLPMPQVKHPPTGSPKLAHKRGGEIIAYDLDEPINEEQTRKLIHGYYAGTSYVDAQIGKVLAALEQSKLAQNTVVVLWGDHGFHLGDHGFWTKHTNYEQATRIPLIIRAPGVTKPGSSTRQLAESVDVFPTLCELAGLPAPAGPQAKDGISLVPVLKEANKRLRNHAFHCFPKETLGRAIRTERYRLIDWGKQKELYDYETDPLETKNLATEKLDVVESLSAILSGYPNPVK